MQIQNFEAPSIETFEEPVALQFSQRTRESLASDPEIVGKIETVDRQIQKRFVLVVEFWVSKKFEQKRSHTLIGILLTKNHDLTLRLTKIICHSNQHVQLELGF